MATFSPAARAAEPACDTPDGRARADYSVRAQRYYYGWGIGSLVLATGQLGAALAVEDRGLATDLVVGGVTGVIGGLATLLQPPPWLAGPPRCADAKQLTFETVAFERSQHSWTAHAVGLVVGMVSGSILWLGYGRAESGLTQLVGTVALNEAQIWTVPHGLPTAHLSLSASAGVFDLAWSF